MSCDLKVTNESARCWETISSYIRDLSEISRGEGGRGGGGGGNRGGGTTHMKNGPLKGGGACKYVSVLM